MRDALYKVTGVPTIGLITIHSVEKTLDKYCALLESSGVAEKATAVVEDPRSFRFNVRGCMFGGGLPQTCLRHVCLPLRLIRRVPRPGEQRRQGEHRAE